MKKSLEVMNTFITLIVYYGIMDVCIYSAHQIVYSKHKQVSIFQLCLNKIVNFVLKNSYSWEFWETSVLKIK